jgi:hypothetical protein
MAASVSTKNAQITCNIIKFPSPTGLLFFFYAVRNARDFYRDPIVHRVGVIAQDRIKLNGLLPGKLYRQQRPAPPATLTLAIAIAFVGVFQTATLSVFPEATGQPPGTIRTAV